MCRGVWRDDRGRRAASAGCSLAGPFPVHALIAVGKLHARSCSSELADELALPSVRDRLLNQVPFEPVVNRFPDGGPRGEHGDSVDVVDLVWVEAPLTEPEPAVLSPPNSLPIGEDHLNFSRIHVGQVPRRYGRFASDDSLTACGKDSLVVLVKRPNGQRRQAVEALGSPLDATSHG